MAGRESQTNPTKSKGYVSHLTYDEQLSWKSFNEPPKDQISGLGFYEKAKLEQNEGRFFLDRYQRSSAEPIERLGRLSGDNVRKTECERRAAVCLAVERMVQRGAYPSALQPSAIEKARFDLLKGVRYRRNRRQ